MEWIALCVALVVLLVLDLFVMRGDRAVMSPKQAAWASIFWVGIAVSFFVVLLAFGDTKDAGNYLTGYLVEKSLSLDNVFVFLLVFTAFGVAEAERHKLLTYGIMGALVMRALFIVVGAAVLDAFSWVAYLFAALLFWTAWRMFKHRHDHGGEEELVEKIKGKLPVAGAALAAIAIVDVIFAIDSVPAILAITDDAFIVFAANAFALLGLRPLFFLVSDLVDRLYYLKTALAALLAFIAAKMVYGELVGKVGPEYSLPVIAGILGTGAVASLVREKRLVVA